MAESVYVDGWRMRRRFERFSKALRTDAACFHEDALRRKVNALPEQGRGLRQFPHALLMALEGGRAVARMLVCVDPAGNGYFSLFEALEHEQAVRDMLDEAVRWLRQHGASRLIGPVAPCSPDLEAGVLCEGFETDAAFADRYNPPYYGVYLEAYGFRTETEWLAYRIERSACAWERYRAAAQWINERLHLQVRDLSRHPRGLVEAMCEVMEETAPPQEEVVRAIGLLQPFLTPGMCPAVFDQSTGEAVGYLIALGRGREKPVRAVNVWIRKGWRRRGVAVLLFDALLEQMRKDGLETIDASFIASDNQASRRTVEAAGGRVIHRYCRYRIHI